MKIVTFDTYIFQVEEYQIQFTENNYHSGKPLVNWLIERLEKNGFFCKQPRKPQGKYIDWTIEVKKDKEKMFISILESDEYPVVKGNSKWEIGIEKPKSLFSFGKESSHTFEEFCQRINKILSEESEISGISWIEICSD